MLGQYQLAKLTRGSRYLGINLPGVIPYSGKAHIKGLIHDISSFHLSIIRLDSGTCMD